MIYVTMDFPEQDSSTIHWK